MNKKIICITGCRSEYDILYPVLRKLQEETAIDFSLVVTGAHLSERFGLTVNDIEEDGFPIAEKIYSLIDSDKEIGKIKSASIIMLGLSQALNRLQPDYVMVVGDREEAIIAGLVCTYLGIPLVHLCGGDRTNAKAGDVDEAVRHATSKMAHLHCTMNKTHKDRLLKMGEEPWRVMNTGNPGLDRFEEVPIMTRDEIISYLGFDLSSIEKPLMLVLQHVISGEALKGEEQMLETLNAVSLIDCNCVINYPNSDMGSRKIIEVLEKFEKRSNIVITKNIPRKEFINILRTVDVLVGNSSMGLLEGSFLKIPVVNVGERNKERMNGGNVVFVEHDSKEIQKVINGILSDPAEREKLRSCESVYGDGNAASKIVSFIKDINKTRSELLAKDITY